MPLTAAAALAALVVLAGGSADVAVQNVRVPKTAVPGDRLAVDATATNKGPETAPDVVVTVQVDGAGAKLAAASGTHNAVCTIAESGKRARCVVGTLGAGISAHVAATVVPASSGRLTTTISVGTPAPDPDMSNQLVRAMTSVVEHDAPTDAAVAGTGLEQPFQQRTTLSITWSATDTGSGIASYDVRTRAAPLRGPWGPYVPWQSATTKKREVYSGRAGSTYCFSGRARDHDGNVSAWSTERCTAILVGAGAAIRRGPWIAGERRGNAPPSLRTRQKGAKLVLRGIQAQHLALVVTRCPGCGSIRIRWRGRTLRDLALAAPSRARHLVALPPPQDLRSGDLEVEVTSSRRTVVVNGFGVSRV